MIVKYTGPHRGGLQQVGTLPISIKHGQPVELPDELAERLLAGAPAHWSKVTPKTEPKGKSDKGRPDADPTPTSPVESPAGEEVTPS